MSILNRLLIMLKYNTIKGLILLTGFLFLVGGGECFTVYLLSLINIEVYHPTRSVGYFNELLNNLPFILIPLGFGVFGWFLMWVVTEKPKVNRNNNKSEADDYYESEYDYYPDNQDDN